MRITSSVGFSALFDRIFAVRHVRGVALPSFFRSVLMSTVTLLVLGSLWVWNKESISRELRFGDPLKLLHRSFIQLGLIYGLGAILTNWIPDYLSLVQSRWVIGRIEETKSPLARIPWIILDAVLTLAIAFAAIYLGAKVILPLVPPASIEVGCFTAETFTLGAAWDIYVAGLRFESPPATLNYDAAGVYIYSTFITSIWLWLHLTARFAQQIAAVVFPSAQRIATRGVFFFIGVLAVCATFWTVHFSLKTYDVRVAYAQEDLGDARQLIEALEAAGLSVTERDDSSSLVVVVERRSRQNPAWPQLRSSIACARRSARSVISYRPYHEVDDLVALAKRRFTVLPRWQVAQCRRADGLRDLPRCTR